MVTSAKTVLPLSQLEKVLNRRSFLGGSLSAVATKRSSQTQSADHFRVGALRWDAWYGASDIARSPAWYAQQALDPAAYQRRAPFFAQRLNRGDMHIAGTRQDLHRELAYAAAGHIGFWIFLWFGAGHPMHRAWELYNAIPDKLGVNWATLIGLNSLAKRFPAHDELVLLFAQNFYEKDGRRPILFILHESASLSEAAKSLDALRTRCTATGIGNPYVVMMSGSYQHGQVANNMIHGDALGAYSCAPPIYNGPRPYSGLNQFVQHFWTQLTAMGTEVVPNGMTGWDRRPRIRQKPPTDRSVLDLGLTMRSYLEPGSPAEIEHHVAALRGFTQASAACRTRIATLYSWNECDEGGNVICPSWTPDGPDTSVLNAVARALS